MHTGSFYNRPPYITTDNRWSSRGGPDRGPEDAEEMPPGGLTDMLERAGMTTEQISLFNAYVTEQGITLQWQYNGEPVLGFILARSAMGTGEGFSVELDGNARQYTDNNLESEGMFNYSITPVYSDGSSAEAATITVSNITTGSGGRFSQQEPQDLTPVVIPNFVGTFQAIAEMELSQLGLKVGTIREEYNPDQPRRTVLAQFPAPGSTMMKGGSVNLVVSTHRPLEENQDQTAE